jgi:dipeptidase E
MKLLLTSSGISNPSIESVLVNLLGKPIAESSALCIPTAIYPFRGGGNGAYRFITGTTSSRMCGLGWKSMGVLELTALPSIDRDSWVPTLEETDALLVWGGDPLYLADWLHKSGLAELLPSLRDTVYVGVSAGSMAMSATFAETYLEPRMPRECAMKSEEIVFPTPRGDIKRTLVTARGAGLVDFALIPHLDGEDHEDATLANAERWAAKLPVPAYAIDDQTAIKVVDGAVEVVSEGHWNLFPA